MTTTVEPILLSIADAARVAGLSRSGAYRLLAEGRLQARKLGGKTLVTMASIRALADSLPEATFRAPPAA